MDKNCLFCKIIAKKIPSQIEFEDEDVLVIRDINPQAPVHALVISKEHLATINDLGEDHFLLAGKMIAAAKRLANQKKIQEGYRLVFNCGAQAGQSVFHIHLHVLGGRPMTWPPG
jgi:histidine triad (HIT) family protein